jgi:hypothetical protein
MIPVGRMKRGIMLPTVLFWALLAFGCSSDTKGGPPASSECASICGKGEALKCPNDVPGLCTMQCEQADMSVACQSQQNALKDCARAATWSCTSGGFAFAEGCNGQREALFFCTHDGGG